ncbi:hypothetical protein PIB30_098772 [Stylosanthes scabra]|uniref:Uncharacterized protein n=1 Tax=Stylosanthes scabra TaxID=79078 RepID=A0ABU6RX18_9FABA|nr:hypothetical protein [Stylosanthes scabra]
MPASTTFHNKGQTNEPVNADLRSCGMYPHVPSANRRGYRDVTGRGNDIWVELAWSSGNWLDRD